MAARFLRVFDQLVEIPLTFLYRQLTIDIVLVSNIQYISFLHPPIFLPSMNPAKSSMTNRTAPSPSSSSGSRRDRLPLKAPRSAFRIKASPDSQWDLVPLSFAKVNPIQLTGSELPLLATANGKFIEGYYKDPKAEKRVKFEAKDGSGMIVKPIADCNADDEEGELTEFNNEEESSFLVISRTAAKSKKKSEAVKPVPLPPKDVDDESDNPNDDPRNTPPPAKVKTSAARPTASRLVSSKPTIAKEALITAAEIEGETPDPSSWSRGR
ncbi:hypothetical protein V5O48_009225 [Marasmius crinis-equi]|uniref:Uncharacterized protein n=1 Tax=Marasmius crinis-equi TaxID=585013 RepID=A0ABR3FBX7_9AGAR